MDKITISISPKVAAVLAKSGNVIAEIQKLVSKFLDACADGKLSFDEILGMISLMITIAGKIFKK